MNSSWSKVEMVCRPRMALLSVEGAPTLLKLQAATFTTLNSTSAMAAATACPPLGWASQEQDERVILCDQRGCANPKSRQYKSKYAYNPGIIRSSATFRSVPWTIDSWKKYTRTKLSVINDSIHTYCAWEGGCFKWQIHMQLLFNEPALGCCRARRIWWPFSHQPVCGSSWFHSVLQMTAGSRQVGRPQ